MEEKKKLTQNNKKQLEMAAIIIVGLLLIIYVLCSIFAKADLHHHTPTALNPIALEIFGKFTIRWYAICIIGGALIVTFWSYYRFFKHLRYDSDTLLTALMGGLICGIIGGRVYYLIFNHEGYEQMKFFEAFIDAIGLGPNGLSGLAIHGALYATIIYTLLYCHFQKIKILGMIEILLPFFMIAQAIGRWGNFMNQEAFGPIVGGFTEGPLTEAQLIQQRLMLRHLLVPNFVIDNMYLTPSSSLGIPRITGYYYPTFFFESILNLGGALGYMFLRKKIKKIYLGDAIPFYLCWYGIVRFIIESLRTDPLMIGNIRIALLTSVIFFVVGIIVFILRRVFKYHCSSARDFLYKGGSLWIDENKDPFIAIEEKKQAKLAKKNKNVIKDDNVENDK